jgi:nucleoside-diphosphate-sugar epimerase
MDEKCMSIIVTGAAGFIGSHLAKRLEEQGARNSLILVDDFSRGKQEYLEYLDVKTKCLHGDLKDYDTARIFTKNADVVYHTASRIGGMQFLHGSPEKELLALQDNLTIDNNVFGACVENKVKKIIYTSSISVYNTKAQDSEHAIFSETSLKEMALEPEGGYGWAKFIGEKQLDMISKCGVHTGILRIFKSYGPCDDYSEGSGQVVCSLMRKAVNYPKERFTVWGNGSAKRCLVYIDDLIDAIIKTGQALDDEEHLTFNVGGNTPIPIKELAQRIVKISGKDIPIEYEASRPAGPMSRIPDLSLIKEKLGWEQTTSLDEGLKKTYEWMRSTI